MSLATVQAQPLPQDSSRSSCERQNHLRLSTTAPMPNPPFIFPQRDPPPSKATSRHSLIAPPLPAFSFPQAPDPAASAVPSLPTTSHSRPVGHRRRPSEFNGSQNVPTLGPPMSEGNVFPMLPPLPSPGPGLTGPGPGRRGHSHRRSAAILSMDLTAVTKAFPPVPVVGSAPVTPADLKQQCVSNEEAARPVSRSFPNPTTHSPPISPGFRLSSPDLSSHSPTQMPKLSPRAHRPLSTIPSDVSMSTIRQYANGSPLSFIANTLTTDASPTRPKTAGTLFDKKPENSKSAEGSPPQKRPLSASASVAGLNKPLSYDHVPELPPLKNNIIEAYSQFSSNAIPKDDSTPLPELEPTTCSSDRPRNSPDRKSSKKQKKVRSWAGILTRKAKKRSNSKKPHSKRAPTPPPILTRTSSEIGSIAEINFDDDNVVVLRTPTLPDAPRQTESIEPSQGKFSLESSWKPRSFYEQGTDSDMLSPVIDLDAALGPFNTPEMGSDRKIGSGFSTATKRMYSGGRRGEFIGPEMRYHRRAESAPEMPPFDRSSLGLARFGGTSTLTNPDVFYEEEEDAFLAGNDDPPSQPSTPVASNDETQPFLGGDLSVTVTGVHSNNSSTSQEPGLGIQVIDSEESPAAVGDISSQTTSSGPGTSRAMEPPIIPFTDAIGISGHSQNHYRSDDIEIFETDDWPSPAEKHTIYPEKRPSTSPEYVYVMSRTPESDLPVSSGNSPSPNSTNTSLEAPRLLTASSTLTDRNTFHSGYSMDHIIDYRHHYRHDSVEDVPSLTSSASTTTGTMSQLSSSFYARAPGEWVSSVSTSIPASRRTSRSNSAKRSSLVSLSKLISGSAGEKSKLSYEEKAPRDEVEKTEKKGHRRISRLMHFWKSKEKRYLEAGGEAGEKNAKQTTLLKLTGRTL
ncbi:hypothetical protein PABG_04256 [Paracoccidioides brasiliensis Pb03]|nr:hypothetical protein PABG_04256 [Paracoccidioides brasiliensis Pb03]